jgi:hypothetical protein
MVSSPAASPRPRYPDPRAGWQSTRLMFSGRPVVFEQIIHSFRLPSGLCFCLSILCCMLHKNIPFKRNILFSVFPAQAKTGEANKVHFEEVVSIE